MVNMIRRAELKRFVAARYTKSFMGLMVFREKSVEQAAEFAFANETDVTNCKRRVLFPRVRLPQGIAVSRMCNRDLFAKSDVLCHRETELGMGIPIKPRRNGISQGISPCLLMFADPSTDLRVRTVRTLECLSRGPSCLIPMDQTDKKSRTRPFFTFLGAAEVRP